MPSGRRWQHNGIRHELEADLPSHTSLSSLPTRALPPRRMPRKRWPLREHLHSVTLQCIMDMVRL